MDSLFVSFQSALAGRYSLERELGRGGMGVVYLAREVQLDRAIAIKLLPPDLAAEPRLRERFMREARTAARLSHPYIVPIHSVDEIGGFVFYTMAYVDGETLAQRVASRGPLPPHEATRILREVAWALAYAHAQGIVHRDVKPANILLERGTERAMVTDFGIARMTQTTGETSVGELLGTPEYMSPEQSAGESLDGRSDLYALGVVGYFALTGSPPFTANSAQAVLAQHLTKTAPSVSVAARGVPHSIAQAIDRCLQKEPSARFATGEALADALAPGRDNRADIPVPVRVFLDRRRMVPVIMPVAMMVPMTLGLVARVVETGSVASSIALGASVVAVALSIPLAIILYRLRKLMSLGYGPDDLVAALRISYQRRREEFLYDHGTERGMREKVFTAIGQGAIVGAAVLVVGTLAIPRVAPFVVPLAVIAGYAGVITTILSSKWRRMRRGVGSAWEKFWGGAKGRRLAALASFRLHRAAIAADRPTEMAIATSAEALYASFPKEVREAIGDVPSALRDLESRARGIRARIDALDATLLEAQSSPARSGGESKRDALAADVANARTEAEQALSDVVTALENLRLDLLRLRAGAGSTEGITRDLAAAREVGEEVDRLSAGQREVRKLLR